MMGALNKVQFSHSSANLGQFDSILIIKEKYIKRWELHSSIGPMRRKKDKTEK